MGPVRVARQLKLVLCRNCVTYPPSTELLSESEPLALYARLVDAAMALMGADAGSFQMLEASGEQTFRSAIRDPRVNADIHGWTPNRSIRWWISSTLIPVRSVIQN